MSGNPVIFIYQQLVKVLALFCEKLCNFNYQKLVKVLALHVFCESYVILNEKSKSGFCSKDS